MRLTGSGRTASKEVQGFRAEGGCEARERRRRRRRPRPRCDEEVKGRDVDAVKETARKGVDGGKE